MTSTKQAERIAKAQAEYDHAVRQATAISTRYTRRQVKRADRALKTAKLSMGARIGGGIALVAIMSVIFISCGVAVGNAQRAEAERVQACIAAYEESTGAAADATVAELCELRSYQRGLGVID